LKMKGLTQHCSLRENRHLVAWLWESGASTGLRKVSHKGTSREFGGAKVVSAGCGAR